MSFLELDKKNNWYIRPWMFFGKRYCISYKQLLGMVSAMAMINLLSIQFIIAHFLDVGFRSLGMIIFGKHVWIQLLLMWLFESLRNILMLKLLKAPVSKRLQTE